MSLTWVEEPVNMLLTGFSCFLANFSAFEVDDEVLANMREYGLANSLYWALAEGHACEQSARRNAMDVSYTSSPHKYCQL